MKNKILIAGGTGFLGFHIIKKLIAKRYTIHSLSSQYPFKHRKLKKVKYIVCDLRNKREILKKVVDKYNYIINLSGYVDHSNKIETIKVHYDGLKNLADHFLNKKISNFIQIGSSLEYGNLKSPQKEKLTGRPAGYYGTAKHKASKYLQKINIKYNFPFTILRLYQVYGPNQKYNRLIPFTIKNCLQNKEFNCSEGNQLRDFLFVDDFTNLIEKILRQKSKNKIFNVGYGQPVTVKKVIELIAKKTKKGRPNFGALKMRKEEIKKLYPDISLVKNTFKWYPNKNLQVGLSKTISFYKKNKNFYI